MVKFKDAHPKSASWVGPAALLPVTGAAGLVLAFMPGGLVPIWPAVGLLVVLATCGLVWLDRVRAARRLFAAMDRYTERELARGTKRRGRSEVRIRRVKKERRPVVA